MVLTVQNNTIQALICSKVIHNLRVKPYKGDGRLNTFQPVSTGVKQTDDRITLLFQPRLLQMMTYTGSLFISRKVPQTIFLHLNENLCCTPLPTFLTVLFRRIYSLSHCLEAWLLSFVGDTRAVRWGLYAFLVMKYIAWNQLLCICIYTHIIFALTVWLKGGRGRERVNCTGLLELYLIGLFHRLRCDS